MLAIFLTIYLASLLALAELDIESGRTRSARDFLKEFKRIVGSMLE